VTVLRVLSRRCSGCCRGGAQGVVVTVFATVVGLFSAAVLRVLS